MIPSDDFESLRKRNDELRAELISASRRTEHLVAASEEFFERRERIRERLATVAVSATIEPGLGVVTVTADRRITLDLDHAKAALSDTSRLGERILTALASAERNLDELVEEALGEATP